MALCPAADAGPFLREYHRLQPPLPPVKVKVIVKVNVSVFAIGIVQQDGDDNQQPPYQQQRHSEILKSSTRLKKFLYIIFSFIYAPQEYSQPALPVPHILHF